MRFHVIAALLASAPQILGAQTPPALSLPVDCVLGELCTIQQFMDHEPGPEVQDFLCGSMSYDTHTGTDFRVADFEALADGVAILAAAPGRVLGTRNTVPDTGAGGFPEGQDCGNGVVIDHGDGWHSQYCHLAQGSVRVATGDQVEQGQILGEMGYSGRTQFPHMHFTLRFMGEPVDPFAPTSTETCGQDQVQLWQPPLPVALGGFLSAGFSPGLPEFDAIRAGTADAAEISADAALVVWGFVHNGQVGDRLRLVIRGPDGSELLAQIVDFDRNQAELFRATGRRAPPEGWTSGLYTGELTLIRDGVPVDTIATQTRVSP